MTVTTKVRLFIDGQWRDGAGGGEREIINPATEAAIGTVALAAPQDLAEALQSAQRGFLVWRSTAALERGRLLRKVGELLRQRAAEIATVLTLEEGKTIAEARDEVDKAADHFDWMADEGLRAYGRIIPTRGKNGRQLVQLEPIGPVAGFTPWNFPATGPARKISTALAAGCSIIIKAAEETPGTCAAIVQACVDAGIPSGVVNLVFGVPSEVSKALIESPLVRKVSFTGSVPVGISLAELAARGLKPCTLELGGQAPFIVFEDADLDLALSAAITGKFRNAGQVCVCPTRFFVHEAHYESFVSAFVTAAGALKVGDGLSPATQMGCVQNHRRIDAMAEFTADAVRSGARVVAGGERIDRKGYFWRPTIIAEAADSALIMNKEPFGPIAGVASFRNFDEVVQRANSTAYGLASYAFTRSAKVAHQIAQSLDAGMLAINGLTVSPPEAPMGGVKDSGYGREGGVEGLLGHLKTKFVSETFN